jgi:FkbM family methyltransferase
MHHLIQKIIILLSDIECITSPSLDHPKRLHLLRDYLRIRCKASLNRWVHFKSEHFLSFKVTIPDYETFFAIFRQVFVRQTYYSRTKNEKPLIIDCGGNIGISVLYWKYIYPDAHIIVFEPSKEVVEIMVKNININKLQNVTIVKKAVSNYEGSMTIYPRGTAACGNTLVSSLAKTARLKDRSVNYNVEVTRLSQYLPELVDIVKLDIEGSEDIVLEELSKSNVLNRVREIVLEYHHDPEMGDKRLENILALCQKENFEIQIFSEDTMFSPQRGVEQHQVYSLSMRMINKKYAI